MQLTQNLLYSCFRYWDAVVKQQQVQRKAEEEIHRQQWTAYFESQAHAGTAAVEEEIGEKESSTARQSDSERETVGVFGGIFYKVDDTSSS